MSTQGLRIAWMALLLACGGATGPADLPGDPGDAVPDVAGDAPVADVAGPPDAPDPVDAAVCPQPVLVIEEGEEVHNGTTLHLHGEQSVSSDGGPVVSYRWTVSQPENNAFLFVPSATVATPTHQAWVAGEYHYCLDVCDADACSDDAACATTACKKVGVLGVGGVHVELTWTNPNDTDPEDGAGPDLDLHFAHPSAAGPDVDGDGAPDPWFDLPYDTFWFNPKPDWESMDPDQKDDPSLDRDDSDGAGPENLNLLRPADDRVYRIAVHAWDDRGFGPSIPRVKMYVWGQLVLDWTLDRPLETCELWEVASVAFPSVVVTRTTNVDGTPRITPDYVSQAFRQVGGGLCGQGSPKD